MQEKKANGKEEDAKGDDKEEGDSKEKEKENEEKEKEKDKHHKEKEKPKRYYKVNEELQAACRYFDRTGAARRFEAQCYRACCWPTRTHSSCIHHVYIAS